MNWWIDRLARALHKEEREAVLGDLEESGLCGWQAAVQVGGLVARRQAAPWVTPRPWVGLVGVAGVCGLSLAGLAMSLTRDAGLQARTWWRYGVRYQTGLTGTEDAAVVLTLMSALALWAWIAGFVLRRLTGGTAVAIAGALALLWVNMGGGFLLLAPVWLGIRRGRREPWPAAAALAGLFMAAAVWWALELRMQGLVRWSAGTLPARGPNGWDALGLAMACWPAVYVLAMGAKRMPMKMAAMAMGTALLAANACAAEGVKTAMIESKARAAAPDFALPDANGHTVRLSALRGKVVLVNFWATYCGGCKVEIPWFQEFADSWGKSGLAVVGLAMDDEGWQIVKPYVGKSRVRYPMVIADKAVLARYTFDAMPATYLIDRKGRIAAKYIGLVDRADIEAKITELLRVR